MHEVRSRRIANCVGGLALAVVCAVSLTACHGGGGKTATSADGVKVDTKQACAALAGLRSSGDALKRVDIADPDASLTALDAAVGAYAAALSTFAQVGPAELRARADAVRVAVIAHHFGAAAADRAAIDTWATSHCSS